MEATNIKSIENNFVITGINKAKLKTSLKTGMGVDYNSGSKSDKKTDSRRFYEYLEAEAKKLKRQSSEGQLCFCEDGEIKEERSYKCSKYYSRSYWNAFADFIKASGLFSRTNHLRLAIENDPNPEELKQILKNMDLSDEECQGIQAELGRVNSHYQIMKESHHCETPKALFQKTKADWKTYEQALKNLFNVAVHANVPHYIFIKVEENINSSASKKHGSPSLFGPTSADKTNLEAFRSVEIMTLLHSEDIAEVELAKKQLRDIMIAFYSLDDRVRGSARRQFYREKYIKKALAEIAETGYSEPIAFREIEKAFQLDRKWQDNFLAAQARKIAKKNLQNAAQTTTSLD